MVRELEEIISKVKLLTVEEQKVIATLIENELRRNKIFASNEDKHGVLAEEAMHSYIASESALAKDWLTKEEDEAWKDL